MEERKKGTGKPYPEQGTRDRPLLLFNKHGRNTDQVIDEISTPFYLFAAQKPRCFF